MTDRPDRDDTDQDDLDDEALAFVELGAKGLRRAGGRIHEEFLVELQGPRATQVYKEMSSNDPIVNGMLFAIEMLIRQVEWRVDPGGTDAVSAELADFVWSCMHDMESPWVEFIAEVMSMMPYGYSPHEIVYKIRQGEDPPATLTELDDGTSVERKPPGSRFDDKRTGWKHLPIRSQESVERWIFDDSHGGDGELVAMEQQPPPDYITRRIPARKLLLFRTTTHKGNPEGRSVLRGAYRPWYFKKIIEEIEAIGIERDLAGLPKATVPQRLFRSTATAEEKAALDQWVRIVRDLRRDSLEGVVVPAEFDSDGNRMYDLELLTTGGSRQIDTTTVIQRKNQEIATTVMADFILLGHEKVGSFALSSSKTALFAVAISGWLDMIIGVMNRQAIPDLLRKNGLPVDDRQPQLAYSDIETPDLDTLAKFLDTLGKIGFPLFPNEPLMETLLEYAGLPIPPDGFDDFEDEPEDEPEAPVAPVPVIVQPDDDVDEN